MDKREAWPGYAPGPELVKVLQRVTDGRGTGRLYLDTTDSAKAIRATLRDHFRGVKFSVRSDRYAGGSSIRVSWSDGPDYETVNALVQPFAGAGFDGMIDLKYYVKHEYDGFSICWGADYVFPERELSEGGRATILQAVCRDLNVENLDYYKTGPGMFVVPGYGQVWDASDVIRRASRTVSL